MININVKHEIRIFNKDGSVELRHHDGDLGLFEGHIDQKVLDQLVKYDGECFARLYTQNARHVDVKSTVISKPEVSLR